MYTQDITETENVGWHLVISVWTESNYKVEKIGTFFWIEFTKTFD